MATDYRPGTTNHVPSGAKARARANIAAITLVRQLEGEDRAATPEEQETLAGWSGWGAVPQIFDGRQEWTTENAQLRGLLSQQEYRRAGANTLNAHYTDPEIAATVWDALRDAGFAGGRVLEPGCGAGTFIGLAPPELPGQRRVHMKDERDSRRREIAAALIDAGAMTVDARTTAMTHRDGRLRCPRPRSPTSMSMG